MRPLKLVMTGFESYCERTEIDFTELGNNGLYIVFGDTGSGKTTIFDAICFALYGKASGKNRDNEMLRSDFAPETLITEVELLFEVDGKKYRVLRRIRNAGDRIPEDDHQFEDLQTGEQIKKTTKVTEKVTEIMGLDKKKFCTVSMIAQGAFQELLLSDQTEKQLLLRDLFDTEKYKRLGDELKAEFAQAKKNREDKKTVVENNLKNLQINDADEKAEEIKCLKNVDFLNEEALKLLQEFVSKDDSKIKELAKQISGIDEKISGLNEKISSAKEYLEISEKISDTKNSISSQNAKIEEAKQEWEKAVEEAKKIDDLTAAKNRLQESLAVYEEIETAQRELIIRRNKIIQLTETNDRLKKELKTKNSDIYSLKDEQKKLSSAGENAAKLSSEISQMEDTIKNLSEIKSAVEKYSVKKSCLQKLQKEYTDAQAEADAKYVEYKHKRDLFNLEQAGILADGLEEGMACPVCGSTNHPQLALKSKEAPSQNEVEALEKENEKLSSAASKKHSETVAANTEVTTLKKTLNERMLSYFDSLECDSENASLLISEKIESENKNLINKKTEFNTESANKKRKEILDTQIPEFEKEFSELEKTIGKNEITISADNSSVEADEKNLNEKKSKLEYKTFTEAENAYKSVSNKIKKLEETVTETLNAKTDLEKNVSALSGTVTGLNSQLKEKKKGNVENLQEEKNKLLEEKSALSILRDEITKRAGSNSTCVKDIAKTYPEYAKLNEYAVMVQELCELTVGRKGTAASLESYVQMTCLDRINHRANLRLKPMTGNQYELRRRFVEDGKDNILDLNVFDYYTGRERDVKSLSGGEQFQASLSLALGLADEIQCSSGGITMDTMFIDEGFGTLDEDTLDKAVKALEDLSESNKLVGIISHVKELESRIPVKMYVEKDDLTKQSTVKIENSLKN